MTLLDVRRDVKDTVLQRFDQMIFSEDVQLGDMSGGLGCAGCRATAVTASASSPGPAAP